MNTYQKYYMAFMESVCKQFNCPEALPALTEGFKDLCEATAKDSFRPSSAPLKVISMMEAVEDIPTDVKQKIADFANMYGIHFTEIDDDVRNTYYRDHESKEPPNADYGLDIGVFDDNWKLTPKGQRAIQYMKAMGFSHEVDYNKYGEPYLLFKFDAKKDPFLNCK